MLNWDISGTKMTALSNGEITGFRTLNISWLVQKQSSLFKIIVSKQCSDLNNMKSIPVTLSLLQNALIMCYYVIWYHSIEYCLITNKPTIYQWITRFYAHNLIFYLASITGCECGLNVWFLVLEAIYMYALRKVNLYFEWRFFCQTGDKF